MVTVESGGRDIATLSLSSAAKEGWMEVAPVLVLDTEEAIDDESDVRCCMRGK